MCPKMNKMKMAMLISELKIKSWKDFRYALRGENALFKMLSECSYNKEYIAAVSTKGENYSAESLFIYLILQQQKIINELIARVSEYKKLQKQTQ
jgi:hypothetical protein